MKNIKNDIQFAKSLLDKGELVVIPTETVYGLAASALNEDAVNKIYALKNRPKNNPLIIHCHSIEQIEKYVTSIPNEAYELAKQFWPGPLTLLLKKNELIPDFVTAGSPFAAFRIPNNSMTLELLKQLDYPLVAPSANPSNRISPTKAQHVYDYFEDKVACILDGGTCAEGIESTIVQFKDNQTLILRPGTIPIEEIQKYVSNVSLNQEVQEHPSAPGMFKKHYSPLTPLSVIQTFKELKSKHLEGKKIALITQKNERRLFENIHQFSFSQTGNLNDIASNLYTTLINVDNQEFDHIIAELAIEEGIGIAINNRLKRANNTKL